MVLRPLRHRASTIVPALAWLALPVALGAQSMSAYVASEFRAGHLTNRLCAQRESRIVEIRAPAAKAHRR